MNDNVKGWTHHVVYILSIILLGLVCYFLYTDLQYSNQNLKASQGRVEELLLENESIMSVRDSYLVDNERLKGELELSRKDYKELKKKFDIKEIERVVEVETVIRYDTVDRFIEVDRGLFTYSDDWLSCEMDTNVPKLNQLEMRVPVKIGMDNNKVMVWSSNPHVKFTDIESYIKQPKRWDVGIQMGTGLTYDLINNNFGLGLYCGFGFSYKF